VSRINFLLLLAVLLSGLYMVRNAYEARRLFTELDRAQTEARRLDADYQRLQAERHAQATNLRVEQVARERLRLEITETAFAVHSEQVGPALAALTEAGFELSIDDFGTGQSSLGRLAEIAVHELKLDRSLVRGIEHDARARRVAGLIVELGRDLGVEVLAEGIETEGQLAVLQQLGCVLGQGWLFGRAEPATQFRPEA